MARLILSAFADEADSSLSGQIAACERNGITQIEMRGVNGRPFVAHTCEEARAVRSVMDDHGMSLSALGSPFGKIKITDPFAPHLEAFKHGLALCHIMGASRVRMFSFFMPEGEDPARYRGEVIDRLGVFLDVAQAEGIALGHENEKGIYGDTAERCLDLYEAFGGRLGGVFDPANFIQCGVKPREACALLADHIRWLHIKDAIAENGRVVPVGHGDGAVAEVLEALCAKTEGDLTLTIEPHLAVFQGLDALEREGEKTDIPAFTYPTNDDAFDAAAAATRALLTRMGYHEVIIEGGKRIWSR